MVYTSEGISNRTEDKYFKTSTWNCFVSPKSVWQREQSCWILLPVALAGAAQVGRVERAPGAQSRWCSVLHRLGWGSGSVCKGQCCGWLALQSFLIQMGSENICNHFYSTCIHGRLIFCKGIEKHMRGVGSAGKRRTRLRWWQWLLLEGSEWNWVGVNKLVPWIQDGAACLILKQGCFIPK